MSTNGKTHRTPDQIELDKNYIVEQWARGHTLTAIAEQLSKLRPYSISKQQVSADLKAIREEWQTSRIDDYQVMVKSEITRLTAVMEEAWEGWRRSQKDQERLQIKYSIKKRKAKPGKANPGGGIPPRLSKKEETKVIKGSYGDPRFLDIILKCVDQIASLQGLKVDRSITAAAIISPSQPDDTAKKAILEKVFVDVLGINKFIPSANVIEVKPEDEIHSEDWPIPEDLPDEGEGMS